MNRDKLTEVIQKSCEKLMATRGYVSPVEVFMDINKLTEENYQSWRLKKIPYLERVLQVNLGKCSLVMKEIRALARKNNWKPSQTAYYSFGKGKKLDLQFSKSGNRYIEEQYRTHYLQAIKNNS